MTKNDIVGDRQSKAGSACCSCSSGICTPEAIEDQASLARAQAHPEISDSQTDYICVSGKLDQDPLLVAVFDGVVQQIPNDSFDASGITHHIARSFIRGKTHSKVVALRQWLSSIDDTLDQRGHVNRVTVEFRCTRVES